MHPGVAMTEILYFTELQGLPVLDVRGRRIGRVRDAALVPVVHPARIDRFLVGGVTLGLPSVTIRSRPFTPGHPSGRRATHSYHSDEYMLRIGRDLLDHR